jgi:dihydrofolate reductase
MKINLIYAQSLDGFIGKDNTLPWRIPEDLARFKYLTTGCPVIMGRKTWDSIPEKFRPLPGRRNIVITRKVDRTTQMMGSPWWCVPDPVSALDVARDFYENNYGDDVWVIGGEQIYNLFLPLADWVHMTLVLGYYPECDARAPVLKLGEWKNVVTERLKSSTGIEYENVTFKREKC